MKNLELILEIVSIGIIAVFAYGVYRLIAIGIL
jgi:hypothetical protein